MKRRVNFIPFLITLFLFLGCATGPMFYVNIDSISTPNANTKKKYILLPGLKDVKPTDLQFKEFARYVEKALASKGYIKVDNFNDAEIAIFLSYGIGDPKEHVFTYFLPVWGQTGVLSSTTFGTLNIYGNHATYSGTTYYTPTYGITGYIPYTGSYTTYFRFLILDAIDLDEYKYSKKILQIWRTVVTSRGRCSDLRRVFPVLVAASKPYIGTNTGKQINVTLKENDKAVVEIKSLKRK